MDKFADDKVKLFDMVRSIEEIDGLVAGIRFEDFAKETQVKDEIVYMLREIGVSARLLSEDFKASYGDVDWDVLTNLQFATWDQEIEIDPNGLWYIIENDLPNIKDQIYEITAVLQDKEDDKFYF
jgi:uncharacterized protein with HEPN domain